MISECVVLFLQLPGSKNAARSQSLFNSEWVSREFMRLPHQHSPGMAIGILYYVMRPSITGAWVFDQSIMRPFLPQRLLHFWFILGCCCFYLTSWFLLFSWCKALCIMLSYLKYWRCHTSSLPPASLFQDLFSIIDVLALFFTGAFDISCLAVNTAWCYRLPPTWFLNP